MNVKCDIHDTFCYFDCFVLCKHVNLFCFFFNFKFIFSSIVINRYNSFVISLSLPEGQLFVLADQTDYYLYDFAPSFQRVLGYPKDFNLEKAGKLCGWCQTYSASVYNRSGTSSQVITWRVWFALLCSSSLAYHFQ